MKVLRAALILAAAHAIPLADKEHEALISDKTRVSKIDDGTTKGGEVNQNFLSAMVAANIAEVQGITDINEVVKDNQKDEKLLPIGEGAYQDHKAVEQRTTDKKMACEDGKWHDCYKEKGDFLDGHSYGNFQHSIFHRSSTVSTACVCCNDRGSKKASSSTNEDFSV